MILSDRDIWYQIDTQQLVIDPTPKIIQPASVDLHLGNRLLKLATNEVDRYGPQPKGTMTEQLSLIGSDIYRLYPGQFLLAEIYEILEVPGHLVGKIEGKSTLARDGMVVENAGYVDPGWKGKLTLELYNLGPATLILRSGQPICQIRFYQILSRPTHLYGDPELGSHYQGSQTVQPGYAPSTPAEKSRTPGGPADAHPESDA